MTMHLLHALGFPALDSEVYLHLLSHPHAGAEEIARALGSPSAEVERSVRRLAASGLCSALHGRSDRYRAAPPEAALDAAVFRHQQALDEVRARARELAVTTASAGERRAGESITVVEGPEAVLSTVAELELGARDEVLIVDSPPYLNGGACNTAELAGLARGVAYRTIYHAPSLAEPGRMELLQLFLDAGEQARSLPDVRMKMVIADRRQAVIPLSSAGADPSFRLHIRSSPLLDALVVAFEALWEKATPLGGPVADGPSEAGGLSDRDRDILRLLGAGAKDRTIARALGIGERTVIRRIRLLLGRLNAATRFQAGVQAARLGLLDDRGRSD